MSPQQSMIELAERATRGSKIDENSDINIGIDVINMLSDREHTRATRHHTL